MNAPGNHAPILSVRGLSVSVYEPGGERTVVSALGFDLQAGEVLALVGESGCGKSKTAEALMGLVPERLGRVQAEHITLGGRELAGLPEKELRKIRGNRISMVFQEPLTALDPVFTAGEQLASVYRRHRGMSRREAQTAVLDRLASVGFSEPDRVRRSYPHELSGGMRQRVVLAMAMACEPDVLIADEPTTALDVTTQAQVLSQLVALGRESGTAILLITHDLGVVAQYADRALVMRNGEQVESAAVQDLFTGPRAAYTAELIGAARELGG